MKSMPVTFNGVPLVLLRFNDGEGALAHPDQIRDGTIALECQFEPGFAHIDADGQVWRYGRSDENARTPPTMMTYRFQYCCIAVERSK